MSKGEICHQGFIVSSFKIIFGFTRSYAVIFCVWRQCDTLLGVFSERVAREVLIPDLPRELAWRLGYVGSWVWLYRLNIFLKKAHLKIKCCTTKLALKWDASGSLPDQVKQVDDFVLWSMIIFMKHLLSSCIIASELCEDDKILLAMSERTMHNENPDQLMFIETHCLHKLCIPYLGSYIRECQMFIVWKRKWMKRERILTNIDCTIRMSNDQIQVECIFEF